MMKILMLFFMLISAQSFSTESAENWIVKSQDRFDGIQVKKSDIYEVVASKWAVAVLYKLKKKQFVELDEHEPDYYTNDHFSKKKGQHTYLVRAVYTNGGTGSFSIFTKEKTVLVYHGSLGKANNFEKTALIINLDFELENIYIETSGAL